MSTTLKELKQHPMWSESDLEYFLNKGYTLDEIKKFWDRDHANGESPVIHSEAPDIVGYFTWEG